jgi:hypothetical protein
MTPRRILPATGLLIAALLPLQERALGQDRSFGRSAEGRPASQAAPRPAPPEAARGGDRLAMQPDFLRRDLRMLSDTLGLAEDQHFILEAIFDDYEAAFTEAARDAASRARPSRGDEARSQAVAEYRRRSREIMQEVQRGGGVGASTDPAAQADELDRRLAELRRELGLDDQPGASDDGSAEAARAWKLENDRLTAEFTERVKSILTPEQMGRWPALERRLTRARTLDDGVLSGERIDLVSIVTALELDAPAAAALAPLLEQYELELHDALLAREAVRAAQADPREPRSAERIMERSVTVRSVNDAFSQRIAAGLSDDARGRFMDAVHEQGFPRIFRDTATGRLFEDALRLTALTDEQRGQVLALQTSYLGELKAINVLLVDLLRQSEPQDLLQRRDRRAAADASSPFALKMKERDALEERYAQILRDALGPELAGQIATRGDLRGSDAERAARAARERGAVGASGAARPERDGKGRPESARDAFIRRYDLDHDGVLSPEERARAAEGARGGSGGGKDGGKDGGNEAGKEGQGGKGGG